MVANSKLLKIILITLQYITIFLCPITKAEEASILATATVIGSAINISVCPDSSVLINGFYNTYCATYSGKSETGYKELVVDL